MSQIIDINVTPTIQDVTINTVDNVTVINVNTITGGGGIQSVQAGDNIDIDNTDPLNPIINATIGGISLPFHPIRLDYVNSTTFTLPANVKAIDVRPNGTSTDIDFTQVGNQLTYNGTMVVGDFLIVVGIYTNVPIGDIPNLNAVTNQGSSSDVNIQTPYAIAPEDLTPLAQVEELISEIPIGGLVDSVNGQTGVVVLDADDIAETTRKFATASQLTKIELNFNKITLLENEKENSSNKQNNLAIDGSGTKFPTVDAVNTVLNSIPLTIADGVPSATVTASVLTLAKEEAIGKLTGKKIIRISKLFHKVGAVAETINAEIRLFDTVTLTETTVAIVGSNGTSGHTAIGRHIAIDTAGGFLRVLDIGAGGNPNDIMIASQNISNITIPNINNDLTVRTYLRNGFTGSGMRQYSSLIQVF